VTAIRNLPDDRIFEVREATAGDVIRVKWTDAAGVPLTLPQLTAVTVTYYDGERPDDVTAGIVNGRMCRRSSRPVRSSIRRSASIT